MPVYLRASGSPAGEVDGSRVSIQDKDLEAAVETVGYVGRRIKNWFDGNDIQLISHKHDLEKYKYESNVYRP